MYTEKKSLGAIITLQELLKAQLQLVKYWGKLKSMP